MRMTFLSTTTTLTTAALATVLLIGCGPALVALGASTGMFTPQEADALLARCSTTSTPLSTPRITSPTRSSPPTLSLGAAYVQLSVTDTSTARGSLLP